MDEEIRILCVDDGKSILTAIKRSFLDKHRTDEIIGIRTTIQDITDLKRAEEKMASLQKQLHQVEETEAAGRLTGGIAHDFNNLLTVIKGYSQLSLIKLKEGDSLKGNIQGSIEPPNGHQI